MVKSACTMWLKEYRVDGLRFDSANDLPGHSIQVRAAFLLGVVCWLAGHCMNFNVCIWICMLIFADWHMCNVHQPS